ncbi:urease accessory protein UreD [Cellulosimicrobium marinum]|uniref:urease accessory protein UreD n=1 Tax=Cellulosimicrobium marinum TaxID=1638992 RepID=UPI001E555F2E|nr:urease accessory protein UreD [Cellulosimicrobium marinum]MCB7136920.1 urease accessory protein UreD [Cellulosimicrobium marinum]
MDGTTHVGVTRAGGRVRCDLRPGALSARVLSTGPASARVALVATRALLLGGDHVRFEVRVGAGVELELVDVSGTVAYTGRGRAASWDVDADVADGGLLVWDALPFVVAEGADVERRTTVRLGADAVALLRETLVLGRTGETGGRLRASTRVERRTGEPGAPAGSEPAWPPVRELFVEDLDLGPDRGLPGILGPARVVDSVLLAGTRPPPPHAGAGRTPLRLDLDGPGAVARHLGASTHDAGLDAVVATWATAARTRHRAGPRDPAPSATHDHRTTLQTTGA